MYKKLFFSFIILVAMIFSFSICFAANENDGMLKNAADGVRNVVGDAENAVENAAKDVSNTSKDVTRDMENDANNAGNNMRNDTTNNNNTSGNTNNNSNNTTASTNGMNNGYSATRTATGTDENTFMGMNATAWTWLILGIAAIAIVALVWYYGSQVNSSNNNYDDRD